MTDQIPDTAEQRDISVQEVVEDVMLGQSRTTEMTTPAEVANLSPLASRSTLPTSTAETCGSTTA